LQRVSEDGCLVHRLNSGVSVHCRSRRYGVFYRNAIHYQRVSHLGRADRGKVHLRGASQLPPSHDSPAYTVIGGRGVLFNAAEGRAQEMQRRPPSLADIQRGGHPGVNGPTDPTDRHQLHNRHLFGQIGRVLVLLLHLLGGQPCLCDTGCQGVQLHGTLQKGKAVQGEHQVPNGEPKLFLVMHNKSIFLVKVRYVTVIN